MKANHAVTKNVRALWISRGLLDIYLEVWMRHAVLYWQKLIITVLVNSVRAKEVVLSVGALSIYVVYCGHIQYPLKLMF